MLWRRGGRKSHSRSCVGRNCCGNLRLHEPGISAACHRGRGHHRHCARSRRGAMPHELCLCSGGVYPRRGGGNPCSGGVYLRRGGGHLCGRAGPAHGLTVCVLRRGGERVLRHSGGGRGGAHANSVADRKLGECAAGNASDHSTKVRDPNQVQSTGRSGPQC